MEGLRQWVGQLVALVVVAGALELLLPEGRMRGYVRMVTGLLVVLALLRPALTLLARQPVPDLAGLAADGAGADRLPSLAEVRARAARLHAGNDSLVLEQFRLRLAAAAADLARAVPGVATAEARAEVAPGPPGGPPVVTAVAVRVRPGAGDAAAPRPSGPDGSPALPGPPGLEDSPPAVAPVRPVRPVETVRPPGAPATRAAPAPDHALAAAVRAAVAGGLGIAPERVQVSLDPG